MQNTKEQTQSGIAENIGTQDNTGAQENIKTNGIEQKTDYAEAKEQGQVKENKMGVMPIGKLLFSVSFPMIVSMLVQAMYNIVDSIFVARFNTDCLTAVSAAFPLQNLMIGVSSGLGVGFNALISRALGEKKFDHANESARQGIFLEIIGYIIFLIVGLFGVRGFMESQDATAAIVEYGVDYGSIVCIFSFGIFMQMTFERLLQSTGKTVYSMITQMLGAIINIILDPILIFGLFGFPRLGIKGAAIATVIGQCVAAVLAIYFNVKKNDELHITLKRFKPDKFIIGKILSVGIPSIIMVAIGSLMTFVFNRILFSFTDIAVAVFGIFFKVQSMIFMPVFGLNNGMIPIVAYNYGARQPDRMMKTVKYSIIAACLFMFAGLLIMELAPEQILKIFDAKEDMMEIGIPALRILSISFIFAGFSISSSGLFQSLGKGVYSMMISFARQIVVLLPAAYLLAKLTNDVKAVWFSFPIAELASLAVAAFLLVNVNKKIIRPMRQTRQEKAEKPINAVNG